MGPWISLCNNVGLVGNILPAATLVFTGLSRSWMLAKDAPGVLIQVIAAINNHETRRPSTASNEEPLLETEHPDMNDAWKELLFVLYQFDDSFRSFWEVSNAGGPWTATFVMSTLVMFLSGATAFSEIEATVSRFAIQIFVTSGIISLGLASALAHLTSRCEMIVMEANQPFSKRSLSHACSQFIDSARNRNMGVYIMGQRLSWIFVLVRSLQVFILLPTFYWLIAVILHHFDDLINTDCNSSREW